MPLYVVQYTHNYVQDVTEPGWRTFILSNEVKVLHVYSPRRLGPVSPDVAQL